MLFFSYSPLGPIPPALPSVGTVYRCPVFSRSRHLFVPSSLLPMDDRTNASKFDFRCQVEADYTVIFFAAGARHNPGWNWVWKAYRSLNRKYRKNLKKLVSVCLFLLPPHLWLCPAPVIPVVRLGRVTGFLLALQTRSLDVLRAVPGFELNLGA